MTREEYLKEIDSVSSFDKEAVLKIVQIAKLYIKSLEELNKHLEHTNTCGTCKYWYDKSCSNNDGIAYNGTNAVYEDDYCKDYEAKQ